MKEKGLNIAVIVSFILILFIVFFATIFRHPDDISFSERRKLAQFPELSFESIVSSEFMKDFDSFSVDQITLRDSFRRLKAYFEFNVMRKYDNNSIFKYGDMVFKTEYPLREDSIKRLCSIINYCDEQYLDGLNVYYTIIPDKNYYLKDTIYLKLDYHEIERIVEMNLHGNIKYIDLFDTLSLDSYFLTDSHWKQEKLDTLVNTLRKKLELDTNYSKDDYVSMRYIPFYGVYYGQSALNVKPDEIIYLRNEITNQAVVTSLEKPDEVFAVYDTTKLGSIDSYNMFLQGPAAVITITNPLNDSGKDLIIFRDSYASSLAPLLLEGYSTITLVDLRYIRPDLLGNSDIVGDYIDFINADVLFMYSSTLFNNSESIQNALSG